MKFTAILILSIIMFSMMPAFSQAATISQKFRTGEITQVDENEVGTDIVNCIKSVYALGKWGYDLFLALKDEDFNQIITLVTQLQTLFTEFTTYCLD